MSAKSSELFCKPRFLEAGSHVSDERENLNLKGWVCFEMRALGGSRGSWAWPNVFSHFLYQPPSPAPAAMTLLMSALYDFTLSIQRRLLRDQREPNSNLSPKVWPNSSTPRCGRRSTWFGNQVPQVQCLVVLSKGCVPLRKWLPLSGLNDLICKVISAPMLLPGLRDFQPNS